MKKLVLIGGGGHCKACIDVIELTGTYTILGILDSKDKQGKKLLGYEFIGTDDDIASFDDDVEFLITVGQITTSAIREKLCALLVNHNKKQATVISPRAYVSNHASIGEGTIVMHDALVNCEATIGKDCIINSKALIEHDSAVGNHCHISTASVVNGGVSIGDRSFVGSNAVIPQLISLPEESFVKAGVCYKGRLT